MVRTFFAERQSLRTEAAKSVIQRPVCLGRDVGHALITLCCPSVHPSHGGVRCLLGQSAHNGSTLDKSETDIALSYCTLIR